MNKHYMCVCNFFFSMIKQSVLKQGSELREMWEDLPFPLDFKIYLFNITNPAEIKAGHKPIVQEIGPFFYE